MSESDPTAPAAPDAAAHHELPCAVVTPGRRWAWSWMWLVPLAAVVLAALLLWQTLAARGPRVTLRFAEGHGIKVGDALRYRGIAVGTVEEVRLAGNLDGVVVAVRLEPDAADVARQGSRFWVVRPQISWQGIDALETVVGARYLGVDPGSGPAQWAFEGLAEPPVVLHPHPDGLEIQLYSPQLAGLARGARVTYRQIPIGSVVAVGLARDAATVDARVYIEPAYRHLVRSNSQFWSTAGLSVDVGIKGLSVNMASLQGLLGRGVAMATPPEPGEPAVQGQRFALHREPEEAWLKWQPALPVGHAMLPPGLATPPMHFATRGRAGWLTRGSQVRGWVTLLGPGWLGPTDLLVAKEAEDEDRLIELAGEAFELNPEPIWEGGGIALMAPPRPRRGRIATTSDESAWALDQVRAATEPEDVVVVINDPAATARPIDVARLRSAELPGLRGWEVEASLPFDERWHGAAVLSRSDGKLLGLLLRYHGHVVISLLPEDLGEMLRSR